MAGFSDLTKVLEKEIEGWEGKPVSTNVGFVATVGDGVATAYGLSGCVYGELIEFGSGAVGMAMNLNEDSVGIVILSGEDSVKDGDEARGTGRVVSVPCSEKLVGRVIDPLGRPVDGKGPIEAGADGKMTGMPVESPAPRVVDRSGVNTPLATGLLSIDAMIPIGRGQRELIIGDRQTGKTAIAMDTIVNQKGKGVICVYCAIGQKASSVMANLESLQQRGAMDYTYFVLASASDSAAFQYLAPYSAVATAEYFMHKGKDVLVIYDDLTKHATAYRAISLLLRRPPGREAFPGDVFYLHSRLLERSAKLSKELGGGSITALPIVETQAGDISAYIPTNVISITDGQIFLDTELFASGFRPAVDVGLSVSRVGGDAQTKAVKKVASRLRLDLAQYREMASFAQFGSDLDKETQEKLAQGSRLMEMLKQKQFSPYAMEDMVAMLYLATNGYLQQVELKDVHQFFKLFLDMIHVNYKDTLDAIAKDGVLTDELKDKLDEACKKFLTTWKK